MNIGNGEILQGDNLELMKTIESDTIDLIYCDILYGTGRKFADYQDLNRKFIGCDINPNCFEKAKERGLFSFTDLPTNTQSKNETFFFSFLCGGKIKIE